MSGLQFVTKTLRSNFFNSNNTFKIMLNNLELARCNVNTTQDSAYINYMFVEPNFRNRKLGSDLLKYSEEYLWNNNINFIYLQIWTIQKTFILKIIIMLLNIQVMYMMTVRKFMTCIT